MLPASRAAWVPVFIATPTSACASAGASFVPSPVIATSRPSACCARISVELRLRRRLGEEVVDARLVGDLRRREPVVAGDHHRADAHRAQPVEALAHAVLDDVLELDHAEHLGVAGDGERRRALRGRRGRARPRARGGAWPPSSATQRRIASPAPLRSRVPLKSTPLIRVCAVNGTKRASQRARARARAARTAWRARRSSGPRASRRPATPSAPPRRAPPRATPGIGTNAAAWRLPSVIVPVLSSSSTSTSPDASTARPDSASTLRRTSRSMPAIPIALSSAPIVVGISATSSAISTVIEMSVPANSPNGRSVTTTTRKTIVSPASRIDERDLVRRLAPRGALDERDHPVEERLPGLLRDLDHDPVREHARAAGDRAAVAAGLADDRAPTRR